MATKALWLADQAVGGHSAWRTDTLTCELVTQAGSAVTGPAVGEAPVASGAAGAVTANDVAPAGALAPEGFACGAYGTHLVAATREGPIVVEERQGGGSVPAEQRRAAGANVVALGGTVADEVIGFVQGLLLEVTGAVGILRDDKYVVLPDKTWSLLQGPSRRAWLGECAQSLCSVEQVMVQPPQTG